MAAPGPEAARVRPARELIADVGGAVALGAVLLPVAGVVVRYMSYSVAQTVNYPLELAIAASPAQLVATGFGSLLIGLALLPVIPLLGYLGRIQHHAEKSHQFTRQVDAAREKFEALTKQSDASKEGASEADVSKAQWETLGTEVDRLVTEQKRLNEQRPKELPGPPRVFAPIFNAMGRHKRLVNGITITLGAIYWVGLFLLGPWPISLATIGIVLALLAVPRIARRTGRVALSHVWPVVVVVLLIAAVGAGFDGTYVIGAVAGDYQFAAGTRLVDGRYVWLGEASGQTILMPCGQAKPPVTAVDNSKIITVGVEPWKSRSLASQNLFWILTGHAPAYGLHNPC
jgi:hypothetical protein